MLYLNFHGGKCCGIKTIRGFKSLPTNEEPALTGDRNRSNNLKVPSQDQCGVDVSSKDQFYNGDAPQETTLDRFDRYIDFVKQHRPIHMIEVILATNDRTYEEYKKCHPTYTEEQIVASCGDQRLWFPLLQERGFIKVNSWKNSNSGNTCHVFYLNVGDGGSTSGSAKIEEHEIIDIEYEEDEEDGIIDIEFEECED